MPKQPMMMKEKEMKGMMKQMMPKAANTIAAGKMKRRMKKNKKQKPTIAQGGY